ncbi:unnamed protein product [Ranitomeya imitator]|uniref:Solute carrier family 22 member 13 n=1 Tax=Ranitomeya imitator TaxID=111125 RepID=A0ABN9KUM0_9NEOB|nr:unnamed protein product [Ranitomeya imitator]
MWCAALRVEGLGELIGFLPESPRWLLTKGKNEKAKNLLQKAATFNRRTLPEDLLTQLQEEKQIKSGSMVDMFRLPSLRRITLVMSFIWFVNSLVYYGLSLNVGSFGLDIYLTQLIFGAVEIPSRLGSMFIVQIFGRKLSQSLCLFLGGTVCLIITAIPRSLPVVVTVLAVIGKFAIAASFSISQIYAAELFPTIIRQNGVGLCSMTARVAGIIAPLISLLDKHHPAIPMAIYGSGPIIGGLLCFILPETRNRDLQDHSHEANGIPSWILENSPNITEEDQLNLTIPRTEHGSYEQCVMYTPVDWDLESIQRYGLNDSEDCRNGWVYDTSQQSQHWL